jgi:hypothetical protein
LTPGNRFLSETKASLEKEPYTISIGCDLYTRDQENAVLDTTTGEVVTRRLEHSEKLVRRLTSLKNQLHYLPMSQGVRRKRKLRERARAWGFGSADAVAGEAILEQPQGGEFSGAESERTLPRPDASGPRVALLHDVSEASSKHIL